MKELFKITPRKLLWLLLVPLIAYILVTAFSGQ